jgi:hypothetical protein
MKTRIVFSTETNDSDFMFDLPIIPRIGEYFKVNDFLNLTQLAAIKETAQCWSGNKGLVQSVEYCKNDDGVFVELYVWCED